MFSSLRAESLSATIYDACRHWRTRLMSSSLARYPRHLLPPQRSSPCALASQLFHERTAEDTVHLLAARLNSIDSPPVPHHQPSNQA